MLYKRSTSTNILITEKMGTTAPLAIGTRGTVGSLVRREIEYFRRLECVETSKKPSPKNYVGISSNKTSFPTSRVKTPTLGSLLTMSWRRKGRKSNSTSSTSGSNNNSNSFLPSMCSAVDVSESKKFGGFSYRNLKVDMNVH